MANCWPILHISILIAVSAVSAVANCRENCMTEIRVNDPQAKISIDGELIALGRAKVPCKELPQTAVIVSADQHTFSRVLPGAADFNSQDSSWNIRLQDYLPNHFNQESSHDQAVDEKILPSSELKQLTREVANLREIIGQLKSSSAIDSLSRKVASSPPAKDFETIKGTFLQIRAFSGLKASQSSLNEQLSSLHTPLAGRKIILCPSHVPSLKQNWTKVLVGPLVSLQEAQTLAKNIGENSFSVRDPKCAKNLTTQFKVAQ